MSLGEGRFLKADGETFHQKGKLAWYAKKNVVSVKPKGHKPIGTVLEDSIWPDMWVTVEIWNKKEFKRYWNEVTPNEVKLRVLRAKNQKRPLSNRGDLAGSQAWTLEEIKAVSSEIYEESKKHKRRNMGPVLRGIVWIKSKGICFYCGIQTVFNGAKNGERQASNQFTVDHRKPVKLGGGDSPLNLVGCCQKCNTLKKDMTEEEFIKKFKHYLSERTRNAEVKA